MLFKARNGQIPVGDTVMHYVSFGWGSKNLIVLPGLSDGLTTVQGKALLLAKPFSPLFRDYTVYIFSRKDNLPASCSIREMARDQAAALHGLGIEKTSVLGVSQGGMIAQYLAIDHPEMVEKLVLAVTAPSANETVASAVTGWIHMAEEGNHQSLMLDTAKKSYSDKHLKKNRLFLPLLGLMGKPRSYDRFFTNANAILQFDATGELHKISCPTLILGGSEDKTVGAHAARSLKEGIQGSELHIYQGLGHAAYEEAPDFYKRIFAFLQK